MKRVFYWAVPAALAIDVIIGAVDHGWFYATGWLVALVFYPAAFRKELGFTKEGT